jgi:phage/plasmid-associated DNA primase
LAQIMREIRKWLKLAIHIQEFHEGRPANSRKLLTKYGESARAADEVLKLLRPHISSSFQTPKHLICFSNGLVDLSTGVLLGPAQPEDCVKHSIPHPYDPSVDTTEFQEIMRGFFPPACYGPDAEPIVQFFERWQGYRLTGEQREIGPRQPECCCLRPRDLPQPFHGGVSARGGWEQRRSLCSSTR